MFRLKGAVLLCFVFALLLGLVGCGGGGGGGGSAGGNGSGTAEVFMVDAPPDPSITSVEVDITRVEIQVNGDWIVLSSSARTYDLLDLQEVPVSIASRTAPAGTYNSVRLIINQARVTDGDGTHLVTIAGSSAATIPLSFQVQQGLTTSLLLDFNVDRSLIKVSQGNYVLTPVIPAVIRGNAGTVTGVAADANGNLVNAKVRAVYTAGTNYAINWPVNIASSRADGKFKIWALLPGTYKLEFEYGEGAGLKTALVENVVVTAGGNAEVGTVILQ